MFDYGGITMTIEQAKELISELSEEEKLTLYDWLLALQGTT